ncbi:uncharacterized protein LOC123037803 [Drosophila rhopaloa]|uniref:SAM domain-containing protein n=1 Tax=Drosophila rhopaloa TaxID=1041015 RepID=A0ABM5JBN1_DRORH|nr:uncharacterized protein LOC123037803 [Drosophila rhopaloa]
MVHNSRMSIVEWLDLLELQQYEGNLQEFSIVDDVVDITDKELKQCGVRGAHRQIMVNSLLGVRAKRRQSMNLEAVSSVPQVVRRRKNSCPLVKLGESSADMAGCRDSGPGVITTKSGKILKQLTFDETSTM